MSTLDLTPISQLLPITNGVKLIEKAAFGPNIVQLTIGRKITWDTSKFELLRAEVTLIADQEATSGASLSVTVNEVVLEPIRWHAFETQEQKSSRDITANILRGENTFVFTYEVSGLQVLAQTAKVQASLNLLFDPKGTGSDSTPADSGSEEDKDRWKKFWQSVESNAKMIVVLGVLATAAAGIGYIYYKTSWLGKVSRIFNR